MLRDQAVSLVRETFTSGFDESRFLRFVRNLVNHLDESKRQVWTQNKTAFQGYVRDFTRLGTYTDPRGERIDVLVIYLRKETTLERGRSTLRNFVADYMTSGYGRGTAAVIAAFVSPTEDDWRFSFVKLDFTLETTDLGFVTERAQLTPARRYSYLVGTNENCHTAQKQFLELLETDQADPSVAALEEAFSVEKVTKEFFARYRTLFERSRDALESFLKKAPQIQDDFAGRGIRTDDFAKKLLGQIVFLYFLQKKGWFGVELRKPWGSGRRDFVRHLFVNRTDYAHAPGGRARASNFFNDILEPLFYEALAYPRLDDDHYYSRFNCRIPFLNGGLFEPLYGYNWVDTDVLIPDALFSNQELSDEGDIGTGILDVFDRYNFTVNEAEPLEREVAVDPEMLGKVFENLLPENIRHTGGTYYTPRIIVHYMCRQALLHYLSTNAPDIPNDEVAAFLRLAERFTDFEIRRGKVAQVETVLPESISRNATVIDELLASITVCDPAIGSGAFPVGMMQEIVRARMALTPAIDAPKQAQHATARSGYALKRHAIQHCLYGVDQDPGAVEIAKLRLWLSMVVDEDEIRDIQPLPNLDYKIMQGNSLLEEFDGVALVDERLLQPEEEASPDPRIADIDAERQRVQREVVRLQSAGRLTTTAARDLKQAGARLAKERKSLADAAPRRTRSHPELPLGSKGSLKRIQQLHADFFDESSRIKKEKLRSELDRLEWDFMHLTLSEQGREDALRELEHANAVHRKPFFLWRIHFSEVFQRRGGFDVVIANPPYVRMELIKEEKPALRRRFSHLFAGRADLYVYFYGLGLSILRPGGCLAFISSNSYLNSKFGGKLRTHLLDTTSISTLIDFAETKVFDAVVEPAIIVLQKNPVPPTTIRTVKWNESQALEDLPEIVAKDGMLLSQTTLTEEPWQLVPPHTARILHTMRAGRTRLADHPDWKPLRGVVTGLNEAFVIDGAKRAEILRSNPNAEAIIHRFLRGRDIAKWTASFADTYIIYAYHGVDMAQFPAVKAHLLPFREALERRATKQPWYELQQPQMAYEKYFRGSKLVYQEINRTDAFAFDVGDPAGMFVNNKVFFIPNAPKALLALMNSAVGAFFLHIYSGVPPGGFLALQLNIITALPIPNWSDSEQRILNTLVDYVLWLNRKSADLVTPEEERDRTLFAGYFEQWINALIYELFFADTLHAAGLNFFRLAQDANLRQLSEMRRGKTLGELRALFEEMYDPSHQLRRCLFALDSIEEVRIVEGKA